MRQDGRLGRFTHEIMRDGLLEEMLERLPAHELAPAIAAPPASPPITCAGRRPTAGKNTAANPSPATTPLRR